MQVDALFTFEQFFSYIRPGISMAVAFLNIPVFKSDTLGLDIGLWHILLGLLLFSFVIGFIIKGAVFNGSFIPGAAAAARPGTETTVDAHSVTLSHSDSTISYDIAGSLSGRAGGSSLPAHDGNRVYVDDYEVH